MQRYQSIIGGSNAQMTKSWPDTITAATWIAKSLRNIRKKRFSRQWSPERWQNYSFHTVKPGNFFQKSVSEGIPGKHVFLDEEIVRLFLQNLIVVDGHFSHTNNMQLVMAAEEQAVFEKEIELICLLSGQTHILQPLDVSVFGCVQKRWADYLRHFSFKPSKDVSCVWIFDIISAPFPSYQPLYLFQQVQLSLE